MKKSKELKADEIYTVYMKALLEAKPTDEEFAEVRASMDTMIKFWDVYNLREMHDGLQRLKFSETDIFSKLLYEKSQMLTIIQNNWDHVLEFYRAVSEWMKTERVTLNEAIKLEVTRAKRPVYTRHISYNDASNYFLSEAAKVEFYVHARVGLIMGVDNYRGGPDADTIREIAQFQVVHDNKIYLELDYGLKGLKFSPAACLGFLQQNFNRTAITELLRKIQLMPTALQQVNGLVQGQRQLTLAQARTEVFNATSALSADDFDLLLSPANKLPLEPILSNVITATSAPSSSTAAMARLNPELLAVQSNSVSSLLSRASEAASKFVTAVVEHVNVDTAAAIMVADSVKDTVKSVANAAPALLEAPISYGKQFSQRNIDPADLNILITASITVSSCFLLLLVYKCRPDYITRPISLARNAGRQIMGLFCNQDEEDALPTHNAVVENHGHSHKYY